MAIYFAAYILIGFSIIIKHGKTPEERRRNQCRFLFLVLFLMLALRHPSMGVDLVYGESYGYLGRFSYIAELSWKSVILSQVSNYERGYILFNKLLSLISVDQQILLIGCAALSCGCIFYTVGKKSYSPAMSIIVYMGLPTFLLLFSGLRQSIAVSICFLSISFIEEKKICKFIIAVLIACTFHYSAWIFLMAYPVYYFPMKRSWRLLTIPVPFLLFIFRNPLFALFSQLLKTNAAADNNNSITLFLVFILVYIFCWIFSGERKDTSGLKNIFFVACCIQALAGVNSLVVRAGYYFINSLILLLPMVTGRMHNRKNARILNVAIYTCFALFGLYSIYKGGWAETYPYIWFWDHTI